MTVEEYVVGHALFKDEALRNRLLNYPPLEVPMGPFLLEDLRSGFDPVGLMMDGWRMHLLVEPVMEILDRRMTSVEENEGGVLLYLEFLSFPWLYSCH